MADSETYTGIDEPPAGQFDNEKIDKATKQKLEDEKRKLAEVTPVLQDIVDMIEREREVQLSFIADYVDNTKDDDDNFWAELKAAGRYRKYLEVLKSKFALELRETRRKDER